MSSSSAQLCGRVGNARLASGGTAALGSTKGVLLAVFAAVAVSFAGLSLHAQERYGQSLQQAGQTPRGFTERLNSGTLGVISGGADGTYIRIAADLANVLDGDDLRVLPTIGRGSLQNLRDIMFLRGIDIGIVQMDAREGLKSEGLQDQALARLRYVTRLYNEEIHILARQDITDVRQLDGKRVNIDKAGSGTNLTSRIIFEKLGIKPEFTTYDQASSYERLRSGELEAAIYVAGRPVRAISEFQQADGFHLLGIPFEGEIADLYFPAKFGPTDYPRLVPDGQEVNTVAVGSILAVFNWPERSDRYKRVERFVQAFFSRFGEFLKPGRHPKWKEVNLTAEVPGWQRTKPAQEWVDAGAGRVTAQAPSASDFSVFLQGRDLSASASDRERLYREFLVWHRRNGSPQTGATR